MVLGWRQSTNLEAVTWMRSQPSGSGAVQDLGFPLVQQPAYAPELDPVERLIKELRRGVEGKVKEHYIDLIV